MSRPHAFAPSQAFPRKFILALTGASLTLALVSAPVRAQNPPAQTPPPPAAGGKVAVPGVTPAPAPAPARKKMTDAEVQAMANDLEQKLVPMGMDVQNLLNTGEIRGFEKVFSRSRFAYEVMQGIDYGKELSPELKKALGDAANMGVLFYPWDNLSRFRFMSVKNVDGRLGLFMRCIHPNGSMSYFTFYLGASEDNQGLRVVDIYVHRAAQRRSTLARHFVAYSAITQGWLTPDKFQIDVSVQDLRKISEMGAALSTNNLAAINTIYAGVSEQGKYIPFVLMIHMAANLETPATFAADFKKMNEVAPNEIAQDLMMTDKLTSESKWDEAIEALKVLDKKVEGDPYLTLKIARCYYEKAGETTDPAKKTEFQDTSGKMAVDAIRAEPDLHAAYMLLLDLEVDKGRYEGAYKMLKLLADKFDLVVAPEEFEKADEYKPFRDSPYFSQWKEYAANKKKTAQAAPTPAPAPAPQKK